MVDMIRPAGSYSGGKNIKVENWDTSLLFLSIIPNSCVILSELSFLSFRFHVYKLGIIIS